LRIIAKGFLSLLVVLTFAAIVYLIVTRPRETETWAVLAGLLAVLAASIAAWPALRVLDIQEDLLRPNPIPYLDVTSRYQLMQLRVKNFGVGVAYSLELLWKEHPKKEDGQDVSELDHIGVLLPQDSASVMIGRSHELFRKYESLTFTGVIKFRDASGSLRSRPFHVSCDGHRKQLLHDDELPRTLYDLQQIPQRLAEIAEAISQNAKACDNV